MTHSNIIIKTSCRRQPGDNDVNNEEDRNREIIISAKFEKYKRLRIKIRPSFIYMSMT